MTKNETIATPLRKEVDEFLSGLSDGSLVSNLLAEEVAADYRAAMSDALEALELADALLRGANMNRNVVERKVTSAIALLQSVDSSIVNAHLIAAAPDLAEVARMVVKAADLAGLSGPLGDAARAALARARGEDAPTT